MGIVLPLAAGPLHGIILKYHYHTPDFTDSLGLWLYWSLATAALLGAILRRQAMTTGFGIIGGQYLGTGIIIGLFENPLAIVGVVLSCSVGLLLAAAALLGIKVRALAERLLHIGKGGHDGDDPQATSLMADNKRALTNTSTEAGLVLVHTLVRCFCRGVGASVYPAHVEHMFDCN